VNKLHISGRTALITGAASGIGNATARALAARGANVVLLDVDEQAVELAAEQIGGQAIAFAADVRDWDSLTRAVDGAIDRFDRIDIVFANAGIAPAQATTIATTGIADFERIIDVDLLGVWRTVRAALPQVIANRGHIVVNASIYAFVNGVANAPYAMSKAGVEQFGRALRSELAPTGATAGVLFPGWIATPLSKAAFGGDDLATRLRGRANPGPLGRLVTPDAVATAAATASRNAVRRFSYRPCGRPCIVSAGSSDRSATGGSSTTRKSGDWSKPSTPALPTRSKSSTPAQPTPQRIQTFQTNAQESAADIASRAACPEQATSAPKAALLAGSPRQPLRARSSTLGGFSAAVLGHAARDQPRRSNAVRASSRAPRRRSSRRQGA
jgi:NAD(P)-dependent dehydrogenase (short-subunit alcohol dehydrogenase family)